MDREKAIQLCRQMVSFEEQRFGSDHSDNAQAEQWRDVVRLLESDQQQLRDRDVRIGELEKRSDTMAGLYAGAIRQLAVANDSHDTTKAQLARVIGALDELQNPRPLDEYHDDYGSVLWWLLPVNEPPYVGAPGDSDWPGYHTHWTKCPQLKETEDHA